MGASWCDLLPDAQAQSTANSWVNQLLCTSAMYLTLMINKVTLKKILFGIIVTCHNLLHVLLHLVLAPSGSFSVATPHCLFTLGPGCSIWWPC